MKLKLTNICLTLAVLLGSAGVSVSADFQKSFTAYKSGDYVTALREWKLFAEQGYASAQYNLGFMYEYGKGVPQNSETAVKWYRLAAEQGYANAQSNLGLMYNNGKGVLQNSKTSVKWYRLAAEQGYASAQTNLGVMYNNGEGVLQDYVRAHMWYNIAATSGESKNASKNRDIITKQMTLYQIETAQTLARECVRKKYKGC
jgi:TPR repeat protein